MEQPLVTVICACYNQSRFCRESLESVKDQTYKNLEIIIWDDASADNSVKIIENWIRENSALKIHFIKNSENQGICKSLNNAYRFASGKYLQLLALDDILLSDKIERHVSILENSNNNDALVFTDAYLMDDESNLYQNRFIARYINYLSIKSGNFFEQLLVRNFIPAMAVLYKTSVFEKVGLWDEELFFEDYDMMLRIAKSFDFIFDATISVQYRIHGNNTHNIFNKEMLENQFKFLLNYAGQNAKNDEYLKDIIVSKYLSETLSGEERKFFAKVEPENYREKWISKNKNVHLYKVLLRFDLIKQLLDFSSNDNKLK